MATKAPQARRERPSLALRDDPLWYKDAIIYELHVRAFRDSNSDGIGDFRGLTEKLDYLEDLGVTALWLLPFYPSPLRDDGYDIADYNSIHTSYGSMRDFREFLKESHRRGLRVITELVINHTSDQHPWFQKARRAKPGSAARDFYVWSDTPEKYEQTRIIFKDFESSNWAWDPIAHAYYWHRFYSHQPDLNFDNPRVHQAVKQALDFWLRMGVDGMRLDAIPYLFEREGTNCENLPETHVFLKELRRHLDANWKNRMFLAEANQWPEDTVPYFGDGDECHMNFHFPVMPRLYMAIRTEDRFPIIDILKQTPAIPESCQWATFLRNHDELTLEMVTEEERDYMWRAYAADPRARINLGIRRRLAPLLGNDRRTIELMNSLLFALPGTPVLYYGDEIGMGDNIYLGDRNGVRTPMQWSGDRNAGFSSANPQSLFLPVVTDPEYHYEAVNVEAQERNPNSMLWWMKRLIALRKRFRAFGRGDIRFLYPDNRKVLAFTRSYEEERILVVANLSRLTQHVSLDLSEFEGMVPVELFGWTPFPRVGRDPFFLTLGAHSFYWFALAPEAEPERARVAAPSRRRRRAITVRASWDEVLEEGSREDLEQELPAYIARQRWFRGKARTIRSAEITEVIPLERRDLDAYLALTRVEYTDGEGETYVLALAYAGGDDGARIARDHPNAVVTRLCVDSTDAEGVVYDGVLEPAFSAALLDVLRNRRRIKGAHGDVVGAVTPAFRNMLRGGERLEPAPVGVEQSNTTIRFGSRLVLKLYRRLDEGTSLDLELGRFLTDRGFTHAPGVVGHVEYAGAGGPRTLAIANEFVPNEGDAWAYTLDQLGRYFDDVVPGQDLPEVDNPSTHELLEHARRGPDQLARDRIGTFLEDAALLGRRTAEMHRALASSTAEPAFAPEAFTLFYQRSLYQSMRNLVGQVLLLVDRVLPDLDEPERDEAQRMLEGEDAMLKRFRRIIDLKTDAWRVRVHGDYHLGQVLYTGKDFVITDFEGEPIRALSERRLKRSALRDVAGMLRSFHYAAYASLTDREPGLMVRAEDLAERERWATYWYTEVSAAYLGAYLEASAGGVHLPEDLGTVEVLLDSYLLEKAVYEVGYELNNRPDWVGIPLRGVLQLMGE